MTNPVEVGQVWQIDENIDEDVIHWGLGFGVRAGDKFIIKSVDTAWTDREDQLYRCSPLNMQAGEFSLFWMTITQFCHQIDL